MSNEIKIESGKKREFSTGAKRQAAIGKGTPVLVPGDAILDIAKLFEKGAAVYSPRNWEKGLPLGSILDSLERHLQEEKMGRTDENHARALAWNAMIYLATKLRIAEGLLPDLLDDMPHYECHSVAGATTGRITSAKSNVTELDKPQFKIGDKVKIVLRDSADIVIRNQCADAEYQGAYIRPTGSTGSIHIISVGVFDRLLYSDEIFPVEDG